MATDAVAEVFEALAWVEWGQPLSVRYPYGIPVELIRAMHALDAGRASGRADKMRRDREAIERKAGQH